MSKARLILVFLICAAPAVLLLDGPIVHGLVAGAAAVGLAVVARTMRPGEAEFFLSFARPAAALAAIPAIWMLIQVMPIRALANPIWTSAETAIGHALRGAISIDIGETIMALGQYLTIVAIGFWSAAVAVDRQRAEWTLFGLMAATGLIDLIVIVKRLVGPTTFDGGNGLLETTAAINSGAVDCIAMGIAIAAAAGIRALERYETSRAGPNRRRSILLRDLAACVGAAILGMAALLLDARGAALIATGFGVFAVLAVVAIRRLGFGPWGILAIAMSALAVLAFFIAANPDLRTRGLSLGFATPSQGSAISISQRILDDAPLTGTGAGTFAAIAPIYREIDDQTMPVVAPTAAAAVAVELGRPMLWLIAATLAGSIFLLLRASLRRGRDSFYPTAGAGGLITVTLLSFINAGALGTGAGVIAAALLGLAYAQSRSRTAQG